MYKALLLSLSLVLSLVLNDIFAYAPRVDLEYKGGNKRHIGRYGILMPLYGKQNNLLFTNMFLMHDSKSSVEGNFGLGFRKKIQETSIVGIYGFWDVRKIKNVSKKIHQLTIGLEYLISKFETRINGYLPQNKRFLVSSTDTDDIFKLTRNFDPAIGNTIQTINSNTTSKNKYEIPLAGFDAEVGGNIFDRLEAYTAYYYFNGRKGAKSVNGGRLRSSFYVYHWLDIQGELNYDNIRKWSNYLGIRVTWSFANVKNKPVKNSINDKMTQMTIRDVDIIANDTTENTTVVTTNTETTVGFAPAIFTGDDIQKLGLENADISGSAIYKGDDASELEVFFNDTTANSSYNLMGTITKNPNNKIVFLPLLKSDATINTEVSDKILQLFSSTSSTTLNAANATTLLTNTNEQLQAFINSWQKGNFNSQNPTASARLSHKLFWDSDINILLYRSAVGKLATDNIRNIKCAIYGRGDHPIPLIATDPGNRSLGLPFSVMNMKLSTGLLTKLPQAIKDRIIAEGITLDNVEIFYLMQNLNFAADGNPSINEPVTIRYHPKVHFDSPQVQAGYGRLSSIKVFVMPINGAALTPISGGAPQSVNTHELILTNSSGIQTFRGNVWSPRNITVPLTIYDPGNSVAGDQLPPGAFYSLGIDPGTNKAIVTYHHIGHSEGFPDDISNIYNLIESGDFGIPRTLLDTLNRIRNTPNVNNANGFIDEINRFAALNSISYDGSNYVYDGI